MIRCQQTNVGGRSYWVLISQVEHARVSGELAAYWGASPVEPLVPHDELVATIFHHDDGWAEWEQSPGVDPQLGRPLAFTEMSLAESLAIWQRSIETATTFGSLAPYLVSGHFSALLRHSNAWQKTETPATPLARAFLDAQDRLRNGWLQAWLSADESNTPAVADRALEALQFFDALSLWLCCAERSSPHRITTPDRVAMTLTPSASGEIVVLPWPFTVENLDLQVPGRRVAEGMYPTAQALACSPATRVEVSWRLVSAD